MNTACHTITGASEGQAPAALLGERLAPSLPLVALVGNPNVGKSTLFNALTGAHQQVGNWPGKTVARRSGLVRQSGSHPSHSWQCELLDLPGTYSLEPFSPEEAITGEVLAQPDVDAAVVVADATHLERTLYLALQVRETGLPMVVALTMMDVGRRQGISVDVDKLAVGLGLPVCLVEWGDRRSLDHLLITVRRVVEDGRLTDRDWKCQACLKGEGGLTPAVGRPPWGAGAPDGVEEAGERGLAAGQRYALLQRILATSVRRRASVQFSDRLDQWVLHPVIGYVLLLVIMGAFFWLTFAGSAPLIDGLDRGVQWVSGLSRSGLAQLRWGGFALPDWAIGLLVDGIFAGVGTVLSFLPLIVIFFLLFAFLQDSGYLARAAFLLDRFLHRLGLHGRLFFVLLSGYGCNVPGVLAARILENPDDRRAAILLEPLVPCAARLGVMAFMVGAFFREGQAAGVLMGLLALDVLLIALAAWGLRRFAFRGESTPFLLELPDYRWPAGRTLAISTWQEVQHFVQKAATVILVATAAFWAASHLPWGAAPEKTVAGWMGHGLARALGWIGIDWRLGTALVSGAIAKETAISTLAVLLGVGAAGGGATTAAAATGNSSLAALLAASYHPAQLLSFLTVFMLYFPCLATLRVMQAELPGGDRRWLGWGLIGSLGLAVVAGAAAYGLGLWMWAQ